jgi:uncharacterized protein with GYD domain
MPHYLIQVAYNTRGIAGLVKEPQDRIEKVRPAVEALGGRIECAYYAFGEHDIVLTVEMPDNSKAAAMALAVGAGGDRCELPDDGAPYARGGDERDARRRGLGYQPAAGRARASPVPDRRPAAHSARGGFVERVEPVRIGYLTPSHISLAMRRQSPTHRSAGRQMRVSDAPWAARTNL